jgi:hypothetical protein
MKTYYCNCEKHCHGEQRTVSKMTYFSHKKYRDPLSQYSEPLHEYLQQHPIIVPVPGSSWRLTQRSDMVDNIESGPQDDHMTQGVGLVNWDMVKVSVYSAGTFKLANSEVLELYVLWSLFSGDCG